MGDDVLVTSDGVMDTISVFVYPALRLIVAGLTVWYSSGASSNPRYFSGMLSAVLSGFLTYVFLEPLSSQLVWI